MSTDRPLVWLLMGQKAGDNNQLLALAEGLGWPFETRRMHYRAWELLSNRLLGVTLAGIDKAQSSTLAPPWPDLVLTAGRRNEPVARWIRRQSAGRSRIVHLGRPWAPLKSFDLIVTTPQYFLPKRRNVLKNLLPLHGITSERLIMAGSELQPHLGGFPRPYTSVLLGGNSGAYRFTRKKGRQLGLLLDGLARQAGGSLLIVGSARTPNRFFDAVIEQLSVPVRAWRWQPDDKSNPYLGYLALGHQFVVTGESMSMLTEAASIGVPLYIFDPGDHGFWWWLRPHNWHHQVISQRLSLVLAPRRMRRDIRRIQQGMVASGRAAWLGQDWIDPMQIRTQRSNEDIERTVKRVRELLY